MKNYAKIILSVIGVILLAGLGTVLVLSQRIVMNPDGTVGNTAKAYSANTTAPYIFITLLTGAGFLP